MHARLPRRTARAPAAAPAARAASTPILGRYPDSGSQAIARPGANAVSPSEPSQGHTSSGWCSRQPPAEIGEHRLRVAEVRIATDPTPISHAGWRHDAVVESRYHVSGQTQQEVLL